MPPRRYTLTAAVRHLTLSTFCHLTCLFEPLRFWPLKCLLAHAWRALVSLWFSLRYCGWLCADQGLLKMVCQRASQALKPSTSGIKAWVLRSPWKVPAPLPPVPPHSDLTRDGILVLLAGVVIYNAGRHC